MSINMSSPDKTNVSTPLMACDALWGALRQYYARGPAVFDKTPYRITNTAYMAESYAEMVITYLNSPSVALNPQQPVYIVELGAGTGCMGHMLMQALFRKRAYFHSLARQPVCYVMTDFSPATVNFWQHHEQLKPFVDEGWLDFALFNPLEDASLHLINQKQTIEKPNPVSPNANLNGNPIIYIANYFFDSLPHDVIRIVGDQVLRGLVNPSAQLALEATLAADTPMDFAAVPLSFDYEPVSGAVYPDQPVWQRIANHYRQTMQPHGTVILPVGGFTALDRLNALSPNGYMLLMSDKGWCNPDTFRVLKNYHFTVHDSFSFPVNFDALRLYFELNHGQYHHTALDHASLQTALAVISPSTTPACDRLAYTFNETLARRNAINTVFHVPAAFRQNASLASVSDEIEGILGYIRLADFDPFAFLQHTQRLCTLADEMTQAQQRETLTMLNQVRQNYLFHPRSPNVLFFIGSLLFALERWLDSKAMFEAALSEQRPGDYGLDCRRNALNSLGMVYECLGQPDMAEACYRQAEPHAFT